MSAAASQTTSARTRAGPAAPQPSGPGAPPAAAGAPLLAHQDQTLADTVDLFLGSKDTSTEAKAAFQTWEEFDAEASFLVAHGLSSKTKRQLSAGERGEEEALSAGAKRAKLDEEVGSQPEGAHAHPPDRDHSHREENKHPLVRRTDYPGTDLQFVKKFTKTVLTKWKIALQEEEEELEHLGTTKQAKSMGFQFEKMELSKATAKSMKQFFHSAAVHQEQREIVLKRTREVQERIEKAVGGCWREWMCEDCILVENEYWKKKFREKLIGGGALDIALFFRHGASPSTSPPKTFFPNHQSLHQPSKDFFHQSLHQSSKDFFPPFLQRLFCPLQTFQDPHVAFLRAFVTIADHILADNRPAADKAYIDLTIGKTKWHRDAAFGEARHNKGYNHRKVKRDTGNETAFEQSDEIAEWVIALKRIMTAAEGMVLLEQEEGGEGEEVAVLVKEGSVGGVPPVVVERGISSSSGAGKEGR